MLDIIERLDNEEMFVDAIDEAIAEIKRLRQRVDSLNTMQLQLETVMDDFHQSAIYDFGGITLRVTGYPELKATIEKILAI